MKLDVQKRLSSMIFGCSKKHVWFDPDRLTEIKEAITKADIRRLIIDKAIVKMPIVNVSRSRANKIRIQKGKGLRKGKGSLKGSKNSRVKDKRVWINKIRAQRNLLRSLKENNTIDNPTLKKLILKAKGGFFRSRRHIGIYIDELKQMARPTTSKKPEDALKDIETKDIKKRQKSDADQKAPKKEKPAKKLKLKETKQDAESISMSKTDIVE